jgi:beta-glucosidase
VRHAFAFGDRYRNRFHKADDGRIAFPRIPMKARLTRRSLLLGAGSLALMSRMPVGLALGPMADADRSEFIERLIAKMTLEEKAGQLTLMASSFTSKEAAAANPAAAQQRTGQQLSEARAGHLTGVFNGSDVDWHRQLQREALKSRLKIPMLFAADVIHGFRTIFPVPLGEAASFDPDLARRTARAAAMEASAVGIDWTFAPMVDIARDARWGRSVEGSGEDLLLGKRFAQARVQGFQGEGIGRNDAVAACPKHFAAYGAAEGGLDYNTVDVSERTLRQTYFPPFQSGFGAGAVTTMAAFNEISGVPAHGNAWLLDDVLRGEWNFSGLVVSDYTGDNELILHGYAADEKDAARLALLAGVDMSMQSGLYLKYVPELVREGKLPIEKVDTAVRRVLQFKAALGLFDDPYHRMDRKRAQAAQRTPETLALAHEAAVKSVVLLKNEHDLLPLKRSGQRIALIGPMARNWEQTRGPWVLFAGDDSKADLATGMRALMVDATQLDVVEGSDFDEALPGGVDKAVAAAKAADVVVMAVGESLQHSGEAQSRTAIVIPAAQQALIEAVAATGKPLVIVLSNGRALALDGATLDARAILVSWFLGSASGQALADVLFGEVSPSGRLPISFPREPGQVPYYYDHKPTGRPNPEGEKLEAFKTHYRGIPNTALFPFGHGLTYGDVEYGKLALSGESITAEGVLEVSAEIRNRGTRAVEEVVQLYVHDRAASITRPVRELKDYRKVALAAGATETVRFTLRREDLSFVGWDLKPVVEPGMFDVWVAPSAEAAGLHDTFVVV